MRVLDQAWVGLKGAGKFAKAIAEGDLAGEAESLARISGCGVGGGCLDCPALQVREGTLTGRITAWCGDPLVERLDGPKGERTCGCIVAYVPRQARKALEGVEGVARRALALELLQPAGKTLVGTEACPRRRWGRVCGPACACRARRGP